MKPSSLDCGTPTELRRGSIRPLKINYERIKSNLLNRAVLCLGMIYLLIISVFSCKKDVKPTADTGSPAGTAPRAVTYQLVWSDEFNGTSVNTGNWNLDNGNPNVNNEKEYYQAANAA
ncbi:MAG TPA: hypothetical protein VK518_09730, partial [Puia sp.]|nr:hypothetical protein [Puia sp.]